MADKKKEPLLDSSPMTIQEVHAIPEDEFESFSIRKRCELYFEAVAAANYTIPVFIVATLYSIVGILWFVVFYFLVRDPSQEFFSLLNMRKFILYNILHGVLGFGATSGPVGGKNYRPFGATGRTFLTPGTLCSPLLPDVVGLLFKTPGKRSVLAVLVYIVYVAALVWAIMDPSITRVALASAALAVASVFDVIIFFASRGEHYGYHMFCMVFPDWVAGCQWVQLMLWMMCGVSKVGPWFKYVVQVLVKDAVWTPCMPKLFSARVFFKDFPRDYSPSIVARIFGRLGAVGEWVFPLCCLASPGTVVNDVGVFGMIAYHALIWGTQPFASVFEWQYYTQFMTYFLYKRHAIAFPTSPALIGFLLVVLVVLPVVGQLRPSLVPFLMAYRQYAGNWRLGWWVVNKSAKAKLKKIKAYNPIFHWEEAPPETGAERAEYQHMGAFMAVPQFRGIFSILEKFFEDGHHGANDFYFMNSFSALNALLGWDLAVGWNWYRECFRTAVLELAELEVGDCYFLQAEPVGALPPYKLQYRLFDVAKGPLDAEVVAEVPYGDLEGTHPTRTYLKKELMRSGKSIRGTFLSTYY